MCDKRVKSYIAYLNLSQSGLAKVKTNRKHEKSPLIRILKRIQISNHATNYNVN